MTAEELYQKEFGNKESISKESVIRLLKNFAVVLRIEREKALKQSTVNEWHLLPELPEVNKEVLVAIKYYDEPVQAFWTGKEWRGSFAVRDNMMDGFVLDESYKHIQEWIYAWIELPKLPPIPEPF